VNQDGIKILLFSNVGNVKFFLNIFEMLTYDSI